MMIRLREEFDADLPKINYPTEYETDSNRFLLTCDLCARQFYVGQAIFENHFKAFEHHSDHQFVCLECEQESDEFNNPIVRG